MKCFSQLFCKFTIILSLFFSQNTKAANMLDYISCETAFISDVVKDGFTHSCVNTPVLDAVALSFLTLGQSNLYYVRMKMDYDSLFPRNCSRENRADYKADNKDPKISFGMCQNTKIIAENFSSVFTSKSFNRDNYFDKYIDKKPGYEFTFLDTMFPVVAPVVMRGKIQLVEDKICVMVHTFGGYMPFACKYLKEPYPKSIYETDLKYREIYNCSEQAKKSSRTLTPILSPIISCVREMGRDIVNGDKVSGEIDEATKVNLAKAFAVGMNNGRTLNNFQTGMKTIVTLLLTLYVIFFGFKIALGTERMEPKIMINFVIKFVLVTYLSIGINMTSGGSVQRYDGMTQWLFPILLNGVTDIASWMMEETSINGLCSFTKDLYTDNSNISMALWDQIDCRLAYYIGYDQLFEFILTKGEYTMQHSIPPYVFLLIPAIISGSMTLVMLALMYPLMIISFVAYTLCLFVSSIILILILGVLAPVFVPFALFDYTKQYFEKWWKSLLSVMIQPAIAIAFLSIMFSVYDRAFYGKCKFDPIDFQYVPGEQEIKNGEYTKYFRTFQIKADPNSYTEDEYKSCKQSLGVYLNSMTGGVTKAFSSLSSITSATSSGKVVNLSEIRNDESRFPSRDSDYLTGENQPKINWKKGEVFSWSPTIPFEHFIDIIKNLVVCFIVLLVLKNLMESIESFMQSLSGSLIGNATGLSSGAINNSATQITQNASQNLVNKVGKLKEGIKGKLNNTMESKDKNSAAGTSTPQNSVGQTGSGQAATSQNQGSSSSAPSMTNTGSKSS